MPKPMNIKNFNGDQIIIGANANSVILEHNGVNKLETTAAGVNITGAIYVNGAVFEGGGGGSSYTNADTDLHLNIASSEEDQILSYDGVDYVWVDQAAGGGLPSRQSPSSTTASLANNATGNLAIDGYKAYALLSVITDKAAWVRIYTSTAARAADASRSQNTDPAPDAGVIAEVITTGAQTVLVSPGVIGYSMEATPTTVVPCAVTNLSGSTGTVFVSLNLLQLEA